MGFSGTRGWISNGCETTVRCTICVLPLREMLWSGSAYEFEEARFLKIGTDYDLASKYALSNSTAISELVLYPAIFAYEQMRRKDGQIVSRAVV